MPRVKHQTNRNQLSWTLSKTTFYSGFFLLLGHIMKMNNTILFLVFTFSVSIVECMQEVGKPRAWSAQLVLPSVCSLGTTFLVGQTRTRRSAFMDTLMFQIGNPGSFTLARSFVICEYGRRLSCTTVISERSYEYYTARVSRPLNFPAAQQNYLNILFLLCCSVNFWLKILCFRATCSTSRSFSRVVLSVS
jgi:hypothetical protein